MTRATVTRIADAGGVGGSASATLFHASDADSVGVTVTRSSGASDATNPANIVGTTKAGRSCVRCYNMQYNGLLSYINVKYLLAAAKTIPAGSETVSLLVYSDDPANAYYLSTLYVFFDNGGAADTTNYLYSNAIAPLTTILGGGWFLLTWKLRDMSAQGTPATTWANVNGGKVWRVDVRWSVGNDANGEAKGDVYMGGIWFGGRVVPRLILSFDGCYVSQRDRILPDLQAAGIPATLYVARHRLGYSAGYYTEADVDTFYAAGWAVGEHSNIYATGYDNTTNFPTATSITADSVAYQAWQAAKGWTRGLGHKAMPYTALSSITSSARRAVVRDGLTAAGLQTIRSTQAGLGTSVCGRNNALMGYETVRPRTLYSPQLVNGVTPGQAMDYVLKTAAAGMHPHLYAHEVTTGGGAGGGDGISAPVGSNYWLKSDWDAFLALLVSAIKQGLIMPGTIADSGY